jgi:uncharacterized protein
MIMEINLIKIWFGKLLDALKIEKSSGDTLAGYEGPYAGKVVPFHLNSDGITIRGEVFFPTLKPSRQYPVVIICHGIPGSGAARPQNDKGYAPLAEQLTHVGVACVIFNFRGCGASGGNFDMMGWTRDLECVVDKVQNTPYIDPARIVLLGFSGGGAAAIFVAAENPGIFGLAAVGTPSHFGIFERSPEEIVKDFRERGLLRDAGFPASTGKWIDGFREIEPRRWIAYFKGKHLLIVHGDADELIPVDHARELYEKAPAGLAKLLVLPGGVHRLRLDDRCVSVVEKWLREILG